MNLKLSTLEKKLWPGVLTVNKSAGFDLVGTYICVVSSTNSYNVNVQGYCVFETKNMLFLERKNNVSIVNNHNAMLYVCKLAKKDIFFTCNQHIYINGQQINKNVYTRKYLL